jgi:hypothetical protein
MTGGPYVPTAVCPQDDVGREDLSHPFDVVRGDGSEIVVHEA